MSKLEIVRFAPRKGTENFFDDLKKNIDTYFKEKNIEPRGNARMVWKTVAMAAIYFVPYVAMTFGIGTLHPVLFYLSWFVMGIGMVGLGTSVMHDGNHGSYTNNKRVNGLLGGVIHVLGGYDVNWRIQHNILHHTYTNIEGLDEDIDTGGLLRFSPHSAYHKMHRFQHIYAWFLYGLLTLNWATLKDYQAVIKYDKIDLLRKEKLTLKQALLQISMYKVIYYAMLIVLPILFSEMTWWAVVIGFVLMHFTAGIALSAIFQLAHVMGEAEFPKPNDDRKMENNWAVHQLLNTINFAPTNKPLSWFIGGLNYQIEHHLFPHICHVHYPKLSVIVSKTAQMHGLPYQVQPTFRSALVEHGRMLKELGRQA